MNNTTMETYNAKDIILMTWRLPTEIIRIIWQRVSYFDEEPEWLTQLFTSDELDKRCYIFRCSCNSTIKDAMGSVIVNCFANKNDFHYCICKTEVSNKCLARSHPCICACFEKPACTFKHLYMKPHSKIYTNSSYIDNNYVPEFDTSCCQKKYPARKNCVSTFHTCICKRLHVHIKAQTSSRQWHKPIKYHNTCLADEHSCRCSEIFQFNNQHYANGNFPGPCLGLNHISPFQHRIQHQTGVFNTTTGTRRIQKTNKDSRKIIGKKYRKGKCDFNI